MHNNSAHGNIETEEQEAENIFKKELFSCLERNLIERKSNLAVYFNHFVKQLLLRYIKRHQTFHGYQVLFKPTAFKSLSLNITPDLKLFLLGTSLVKVFIVMHAPNIHVDVNKTSLRCHLPSDFYLSVFKRIKTVLFPFHHLFFCWCPK